MKLRGSYPALLTPFRAGSLDEPSLRRLIRFVIRGGSSGVVPCGSTGEAATLSPAEYRHVLSVAVDEARRKVPVIGGVGTNATEKAKETAGIAANHGVDALLV